MVMRILLINPNMIRPAIPPVGLEYVAEYLHQRGHIIELVDFIENIDIEECINSFQPELIGLSIRNIDNVALLTYEFFLDIAKDHIRRLRSITDVPILLGGPAVNLEPESMLEYLEADYAVATSNFKALDDLLVYLQINGVKGNGSQKIFKDFNATVEGRFERGWISYEKYAEQRARIGLITKSGCPHNCVYCDYPHVSGNRVMMRKPEEVVHEIISLYKNGVRHIFFTDANFNIPAPHAVNILRLLNQHHLPELTWEGFISPHPAYISAELIEEIRRSGKDTVYLGIDSLDDKILATINKGFTVDDLTGVIRLIQKYQIKIATSLLFGFPGETYATIKNTFNQIDELSLDLVDVNIGVRVYRGTPLHDDLIREGVLTEESDLLKPRFVPFSNQLIELVHKEKNKRACCKNQGIDQYMAKPYSKIPAMA
jgi:radical SAM superfamily enzyme YgiQ (UPF0313 family)